MRSVETLINAPMDDMPYSCIVAIILSGRFLPSRWVYQYFEYVCYPLIHYIVKRLQSTETVQQFQPHICRGLLPILNTITSALAVPLLAPSAVDDPEQCRRRFRRSLNDEAVLMKEGG